MSVGLLARMEFESKGGERYEVEMYKRDYEDGVYSLTPALDAFTTAENESEDPMEPVRGSTGYMRFMYDGGMNGDAEPWWVDLMPNDATEIAVYLMDGEGVIMWQGYVQPRQYSHDYSEEHQMIELPLVSALEVIKAIEMDATDVMSSATWKELMVEAIGKTGLSVSAIVMPYEWGTERLSSEYVTERVADFNFAAPLLCKASRFAWFERTNAKNDGDPNWREYEGGTYGAMLGDWLRFWGWTIRERGTEWWIVSRRARTYCRLTWAMLTDADRYELDTMQPRTEMQINTRSIMLRDYKLDGTGHSLSVDPAVRTVEVDADTNKIETDVLEITDNDAKFKEVYNGGKFRNGSDLWYYRELIFDFISENIKTWQEYEASSDGSAVYRNKRISWVHYDWYKKDASKKNYSYTDAVMVRLYKMNSQAWTDRRVISVRSGKSYDLKSGWFVLNIRMIRERADQMSVFNGVLELRLRMGGKYWTGSAWTSTPKNFNYTMQRDGDYGYKTQDMKTLEMDCNGAEGYIVEIAERMEGELELTMYDNLGEYQSETFMIENFGVEYYYNDGDQFKAPDSVNKYYATTGATGTDTKEIALKLASDNNNAPGYGLLTYGGDLVDGEKMITPPSVGREAEGARPEEVLLKTARAAYGTRRMKLQMVLTMDGRENPVDHMRREEWNDGLMPVAEEISWADDRRTLTMLSI